MIAKVLSRIFVIAIILLFSQLPVFVDQYEIRLEGHLAESNRQIEAFRTAAAVGGKSLEQYILKFLDQSDTDFKAQGNLMQEAVERNRFLINACEALNKANPLARPVVFIRYVDNQVLKDAWKSFLPGLSLNVNVVVWASIGCIVGLIVLFALKGALGASGPQKTKE